MSPVATLQVMRYEQSFHDDQGTQGALPDRVFDLLKDELGVCCHRCQPLSTQGESSLTGSCAGDA